MKFTTSHNNWRAWLRPPLALLLLALSTQGNADYLSELEAEAKASGGTTEESDKNAWSPDKHGITEGLHKGMSFEEFEKTLHDNHYGSFVFYEKLSPWDKKQVYEAYQKSNSMETVRNEIKSRMTK